ncbi:catalase family protein [Aquabacterium sp.]|uniref:catalase family protein n=1 Tax=Aquabacterium sp. TaxID=1872578 RepID=UPI003D6D7485
MSIQATLPPLLRAGFLLTGLMAGAAWAATAPSPDGELIPADEATSTAAMVSAIRDMVQSGFDADGHAVRDAHRKAHGCVQSTFTVLDKLPPALAQGLFATPRAYHAVIRFSNGSGQSQDDHKGDARGMAVKVMGVAGQKLLDDEQSAGTQDFLMMNSPVFFIRNAGDYVVFQKAMTGGGLSAAGWLAGHLFHETAVLLAIQGRKVVNPLASQYWSTTPSKLGSQQMKFSAKPCAGSAFYTASDTKDRLGDNLTGQLASGGACFDFMVQTRAKPATMPIEDPTIEWKEKESPFVPVARITIGAQVPEQGEACEVRSFTPWHAIAEHRPLGGISRVRKDVYLEISKLRHQLNGQPRIEP